MGLDAGRGHPSSASLLDRGFSGSTRRHAVRRDDRLYVQAEHTLVYPRIVVLPLLAADLPGLDRLAAGIRPASFPGVDGLGVGADGGLLFPDASAAGAGGQSESAR